MNHGTFSLCTPNEAQSGDFLLSLYSRQKKEGYIKNIQCNMQSLFLDFHL